MLRDYLAPQVAEHFEGGDLFILVDRLEGEVFREIKDRRTIKVRLGSGDYFAKIHRGVGWVEIFKNLLSGRWPVLGARNEWLALQALAKAGVPSMTPVLFCEKGSNPASRKSAIVTESLEQKVTLEDFETRDPVFKRKLIVEVASMAKLMHKAGINHRDFYLCHFLMDQDIAQQPVLHLIDLHRAQIRNRVPKRWIVKDLGGLLFSAFEKSLTKRDLLRFVRVYSDLPLREALVQEATFWQQVIERSKKLYLQDHDSVPANITRMLKH